MSLRTTNTITLATGTTIPTIYGDWKNGSGTTLTGTGRLTFSGRGSQTITSAAKTFTQPITIDAPGGSVTLQDAFVTNIVSGTALVITQGTFNAATFNVTLSSTASGFSSSGTGTRTIAIGSGTWTIAGTAGWTTTTSTNLTVTGTGTLSFTGSSKTFAGGNIQTYPTINQGSTGILLITGSNKFQNITNTAIGGVQFAANATNTFDAFNLNGVSGNLLNLSNDLTASQTNLKKVPAWYVGANSVDSGNNTGLIFSAGGGINYLNIAGVNGISGASINKNFFMFY
jgi:hypothetical protein